MAVDSSNALLIGGASALIGFGSAYFTFKKFISDRYGKSKEKANTIYYWCGLIAMIAFGQGVGTVVNELLFSVTNNTNISGEAIARGLLTLVFYPLILFIVAFIIGKFKKKNSKISTLDWHQNIDASIASVNSNSNSNSNSNIIITVLGFLVILLAGYNFLPKNVFNSSTEKTFEIKNCKSCDHGNCEDVDRLKGFKVTLDKVFIFVKASDGQDRISVYPNDPKMKCAILPERNFAFDCNSLDTESGFYSQTTLTFNGKDKFVNTFVQKILGSNAPGVNMNWQCNVN